MGRIFLLFVVLTSVASANDVEELAPEAIAGKSIEALQTLQAQLQTAIDTEIGEAKCTADSQCKALAIGANPCGGPESYQVYSMMNADVEKLLRLASQHQIVRKTLHVKMGTMGACVVIPEPNVQCKDQHCVAIDKPGVIVF